MDGGWLAHHSVAPVTEVVYEQPCLLRKPDRRLFLQPKPLCHGTEDPVNTEGPNRGKSENRTGHKVSVLPALIVQPCFRFVVRHLKEWRGERSDGGVEIVRGQQSRQDGQGDA